MNNNIDPHKVSVLIAIGNTPLLTLSAEGGYLEKDI